MGHDLRLEEDRFTKCDACAAEYYSPEQSKSADRRLVDARRRAERMMTGEEIKALRQSFQLSQQQFEAILGIGAKTVVRWENNTAVQSKAIDNVLNMLKLEPHNIRLLQRLRQAPVNVVVEETPEYLRQFGELEQLVYARIEATDAVQLESVRDVTRAVMLAYVAYKEEQICFVLNERLATA